MNYWIFTSAPYQSEAESYTAREIYQRRMRDQFWGLGERTPNRRNVRLGDAVVFYVARPESAFAGTAELASHCFAPTEKQRSELSHGSPFFTPDYGVLLQSIDTWAMPHPVADIASDLELIKNPTQWWAYLQGGIRQISERDYNAIIVGAAGPSAHTPQETNCQTSFALEAHLEDFIARNWASIPWGTVLEMYRDGEQNGRQFPAGTWSIDFLARDPSKNELVVIELKRGQTSDATIGQVLRYIAWVRENVAASGQTVRGIVVASAVDDALRYAAKAAPSVSVVTYVLNFALNPVKL